MKPVDHSPKRKRSTSQEREDRQSNPRKIPKIGQGSQRSNPPSPLEARPQHTPEVPLPAEFNPRGATEPQLSAGPLLSWLERLTAIVLAESDLSTMPSQCTVPYPPTLQLATVGSGFQLGLLEKFKTIVDAAENPSPVPHINPLWGTFGIQVEMPSAASYASEQEINCTGEAPHPSDSSPCSSAAYAGNPFPGAQVCFFGVRSTVEAIHSGSKRIVSTGIENYRELDEVFGSVGERSSLNSLTCGVNWPQAPYSGDALWNMLRTSQLSSLHLSGLRFDIAGWSKFGQALAANNTLSILSLDYLDVTEEETEAFVEGLLANRSLIEINFEFHSFNSETSRQFFRLLTNELGLQTFTLTATFGTPDLDALVSSLAANRNLKTLKIDGQSKPMDLATARELIKALRTCPQLEALHMGALAIELDAAKELRDYLDCSPLKFDAESLRVGAAGNDMDERRKVIADLVLLDTLKWRREALHESAVTTLACRVAQLREREASAQGIGLSESEIRSSPPKLDEIILAFEAVPGGRRIVHALSDLEISIPDYVYRNLGSESPENSSEDDAN